jgi:hypothetical protein
MNEKLKFWNRRARKVFTLNKYLPQLLLPQIIIKSIYRLVI